MKKHAALVLLVLASLGCSKSGKTPEDAFRYFSLSIALDQPTGMERYGTSEYVRQLAASHFDTIAIVSSIWPKSPTIVKSTTDNGIATLVVQGVNPAGKTVQGTFKLRQDGEYWKVFDGDWDYFGQGQNQTPDQTQTQDPNPQ